MADTNTLCLQLAATVTLWQQLEEMSCTFSPTYAGFGVPNRRKRVFILASMHGDARDVLLSQVRRFFAGLLVQLQSACRYYCSWCCCDAMSWCQDA
jgi:hypothetical protein